jgi:VIT1/CCC1 family predicted Fe2+/Mn2+ transporter
VGGAIAWRLTVQNVAGNSPQTCGRFSGGDEATHVSRPANSEEREASDDRSTAALALLLSIEAVSHVISLDSARTTPRVRQSVHREPTTAVGIARHYIGDVIYGANDGIITTFAVVAGVTGGSLTVRAVLIVGAANLIADGLSMGVGNYLSIRSNESALEAQDLPEQEARPSLHGFATFLAFVAIGALPLFPYVLPDLGIDRFTFSALLTLSGLFSVGASRAIVTVDRWWTAGLEMLVLGVIVAAVAYGSGFLVAAVVSGVAAA